MVSISCPYIKNLGFSRDSVPLRPMFYPYEFLYYFLNNDSTYSVFPGPKTSDTSHFYVDQVYFSYHTTRFDNMDFL